MSSAPSDGVDQLSEAFAARQPITRETGRVVAVASGGGHWVELMLLKPALDQFDPIYVTTNGELGMRDGGL